MSDKSSIEWSDATWNPITGCTKVSEGCQNCYAERIAKRFWKGRHFSDIRFFQEKLDQPKHWKKPRKIFVCSMSDLFHEELPAWMPKFIFETIRTTPRHTYIILTKRPENISRFLPEDWGKGYQNVWLGVTAENQKCADARIRVLLKTPAAVRFVSIEPMLEEINLDAFLWGSAGSTGGYFDRDGKLHYAGMGGQMMTACPRNAIHWVICGCESSSGARPFDEEWARNLKNQCVAAHVPFFYKQGRDKSGVVKLPYLDGKQWIEYPE